MMQERFWLASEARHAARVSWWQGFAIGNATMFIICVILGLFLP